MTSRALAHVDAPLSRDAASSSEPSATLETFPRVCTLADVARIMRISMGTAYRRQAAGLLAPFALASIGTSAPRYSGVALQAWADRTSAPHATTIGRPRAFARRSGVTGVTA
jgi:hypothetical protein